MLKIKKSILLVILALCVGVVASGRQQVSAAKVVQKGILVDQHRWQLDKGSLYKKANLTGRVSGTKYRHVTFYCKYAETVRKSNKKKITCYYLKNKSGSVKGWTNVKNLTWLGNLSVAKQKKDIKAIKAIVQGMSPIVQKEVLPEFKNIKPKNTYITYNAKNTLSDIVGEAGATADVKEKVDVTGIKKIYKYYNGRFDKVNNKVIAKDYQRLLKSIQKKWGSDSVNDSVAYLTEDLNNALLNDLKR